MNCLKCGKETADPHVFCEECQEVMESFPVKPGTAVHLPHRAEPQEKKNHKRIPSTAETIVFLRKSNRRLLVAILILILTVCLLLGALARTITEYKDASQIGKNYTTTTDITTHP